MASLIHEAADSPMYRGVRILVIRELCGCKTIKDFCEHPDSKLKAGTLVGWENGRFNGVSKVGAKKIIARAMDFGLICSYDWLMFGVGQMPTYDQSIREQSTTSALIEHDPFMPLLSHKGLVQFHVPDDAMAPEYNSGDIIAGIKKTAIKNCIGSNCIIQLESGELLVRLVDKSEKPHKVTLRHLNHTSNYASIFDVKIIMAAPVVFRYRKFTRTQ